MGELKAIKDGYEVFLYKEFYDREVFFYIANKYQQSLMVSFAPYGEKGEQVKLTLTGKTADAPVSESMVRQIIAEMDEQQFQIDVLNRTREIRDMVYQKAFSPIEGRR